MICETPWSRNRLVWMNGPIAWMSPRMNFEVHGVGEHFCGCNVAPFPCPYPCPMIVAQSERARQRSVRRPEKVYSTGTDFQAELSMHGIGFQGYQ